MRKPDSNTSDISRFARRGRPFIKMHGLRNDFVIVDGRDQPYTPAIEEIVRICDRREGVGGDELLVIEAPRKVTTLPEAYAFVRIFNPDGREVEACGNATRCVGWLLLQESEREAVWVDTFGGKLGCRRAGEKLVAVEMGRLRTGWQDIPLAREMDTLHLEIGAGPLRDPVGMNIGNPHAVFFVDDLDEIESADLWTTTAAASAFPAGGQYRRGRVSRRQNVEAIRLGTTGGNDHRLRNRCLCRRGCRASPRSDGRKTHDRHHAGRIG